MLGSSLLQAFPATHGRRLLTRFQRCLQLKRILARVAMALDPHHLSSCNPPTWIGEPCRHRPFPPIPTSSLIHLFPLERVSTTSGSTRRLAWTKEPGNSGAPVFLSDCSFFPLLRLQIRKAAIGAAHPAVGPFF